MIPKIKNILYATDLSENSAYAFRYAIHSAEKHDARVHLLHVLEPLPSQTWAYPYPTKIEKVREETKQRFLEKIKKRVEDFFQQDLTDKPECRKRVASIQVIEGYPAGTILQKAEEAKADLVIMGTHSKGALAHAFLGSVAEAVLNRIKVPVYVIPLPG